MQQPSRQQGLSQEFTTRFAVSGDACTGANCAHTSNTLNKMADNLFTIEF
jgi:hypothetical protein